MTKLKKSVLSAFATLILAGVFGAPLPTGCGPLGGGTGISTNQRLVNMECAIMKVYNWCSLSQADCEWLLLSRQRCWYSDHCDKFSLANARFFPSLRRKYCRPRPNFEPWGIKPIIRYIYGSALEDKSGLFCFQRDTISIGQANSYHKSFKLDIPLESGILGELQSGPDLELVFTSFRLCQNCGQWT